MRAGGWYAVWVSLIAAMGGLLFGYDWVVIGGAKPFFEKYFELDLLDPHLSQWLSGWANSCALVGCLGGSLISGMLSDRFGRKPLLLACGLLFAVSSVLTGWAYSYGAFITWRIAGGVAIGMASNLSPMYIAEIAPARLRGRLVAMNQLTIVIGILLAQVVNLLIAEKVPPDATAEWLRLSWSGQIGWRWMFTAVAVPSVVFFACALFVPESPRWLVKRGRLDRARHILARVGGDDHAQTELRDIQATVADEGGGAIRLADLVKPPLVKVLFIGCTLAVLQQWSAINVFFNYAEDIFREAGYGVSDVLQNIVITGTINLLFTFVAIGTVDWLGRRPLMLFGFASIAVMHLLLGGAFGTGAGGRLVMACTLGAIGCYAMTIAPVIWVLIAEIFPNRVRGSAMSVAVSCLWIACFALTFSFPLLKANLGLAGTFWTYAAICAAGWAFVWALVPETKGKTLEELEAAWSE